MVAAWAVTVLGCALLLLTAVGRAAEPWPAECANFYESVCTAEAEEEDSNAGAPASMFAAMAARHDALVRELVRAGADTARPYAACLAHTPAPPAAAPADAADLLRRGLAHPLHADVVPALHAPEAYALDLSLAPALYMLYADLAASDPATVPAWLRALYEQRAARAWLAAEGGGGGGDDEAQLDAYVRAYARWGALKTQLSRRAAALLEAAFAPPGGGPSALTDARWVHCNGMPPAVLNSVLLATLRPGVAALLAEWTLPLLERRAPDAAFAAAPRALQRHWRLLGAAERGWPARGAWRLALGAAARGRAPWAAGAYAGAEEEEGEGDGRAAICTRLVRLAHGAALNRAFFARQHPAGAEAAAWRDAAHALVRDVRESVAQLVHETAWLHEATRNAALRKLSSLAVYVLAPEEEEDAPPAAAGEQPPGADAYERAVYGWLARDWARVAGKLAAAPDRWDLQRHLQHEVLFETVNAWYDPTRNTITVPPGILAAPLYTGALAHDLATLGMVLGHEMGHALDVRGRLFDAHGAYLPAPAADGGGAPSPGWWQAADLDALRAHMACLAAEMGAPCGRADYGMHTMGEDMADQMGLRAAYRLVTAQALYESGPEERAGGAWDDGAASRAFFALYARMWCARLTRARECALVELDVHALPRHRVNAALRQLPAFRAAFGCAPAAPMCNAQPCIIY